jgi:hypothetical protein
MAAELGRLGMEEASVFSPYTIPLYYYVVSGMFEDVTLIPHLMH